MEKPDNQSTHGIEKIASLINIEHIFTAILLALVFGVFSTWQSVERLQWQLAANNAATGERLDRDEGMLQDHELRIRKIEDWRLSHESEPK